MIVTLLIHSTGVNLLYSIYQIDSNLFTELFCVNTSTPELKCNGSCMLSKLEEYNSQENDKPILLDITQHQLQFVIHTVDVDLNPIPNFKDTPSFTYHETLFNSQYLKGIFRPPITV